MSTPPQEPRGNWGPIVALSHHPTFSWPQEWKLFKWLWCPGSRWSAQTDRWDRCASHLRALLSERVNDKNLTCQGGFLRGPCLLQACLYTASNNVTFSSLAAADTSAGFMQERPWAAGRWQQLLSANLPLDIVAVLADRQPGLVGGGGWGCWGDRSPPSAGYHFQLKPFI